MKSNIFLKSIATVMLLCMTLTTSSLEAQGNPGGCFITTFLTVSDQDDVVMEIDPDTLAVISETPISITGAIEIDGLRGIAIHPSTGNWFMLAMLSTLSPNERSERRQPAPALEAPRRGGEGEPTGGGTQE